MPLNWKGIVGSGNGLVPSGNKPLPEPMLTQIYEQCFNANVCVLSIFFLFIFFKFIVTCRLCDIYVREDNDSNI